MMRQLNKSARMMRRLIVAILCLCWVLPLAAQAPTRQPPTPVPQSAPPQDASTQPTESVVNRIQNNGVVRVGVLFNEPPFSELSVRGDIAGYDVDVARALANAWGVEAEFVQVTRQNGVQRLRADEIDLLMGAQVHRRNQDARLEFSHTYRISGQMLMVRADDPARSLFNMANRRVGYALGTPGEAALQGYVEASGVPVSMQPLLLLDAGLRGLFSGDLDGIVGRREHLLRLSAEYLDAIRLLDEPVQVEPIAIGLRRQDAPLRNLVNRTLQHLLANETLPDLHEAYFPGEEFPFDALPLWANIGEAAPTPAQYAGNIPYPQRTAISRILNGESIRVATASNIPGQERVSDFHNTLLNELSRRWGVTIERVGGDPLAQIESGNAEIGLGLQPDWNAAGRVDFTQPYLLHGERLLVPESSNIRSFNDLRGLWIAVLDSEGRQRAQGWADSVDVTVNILESSEQTAAANVVEFNNANVIYGDSLALIGMIAQYPGQLRLTERWYSRDYMALAVPHNDIEFRLLVDYTLQELVRDGTLDQLLRGVIPPGSDLPEFDVWPGPSSYFGLTLAG